MNDDSSRRGGVNGDSSPPPLDRTDSETTPLAGSDRRRRQFHHQFEDDSEDYHPRPTWTDPAVSKQRWFSHAAIGASVVAFIASAITLVLLAFGAWGLYPEDATLPSAATNSTNTSVEAFSFKQESIRNNLKLYDSLGRFVLEDFDSHPPFSDFLPALAGYYGKPLYAFYVNRGQGIASFGIQSKDHPIMEFKSANKAYQSTPLLGFRTFLQLSRHHKALVAEPFSPLRTRFKGSFSESTIASRPKRFMYVGSNEMQIQEIDGANRVETNVTFFILPEEDFGAFVKRTTITNLDKSAPLSLALVDGLARMEPAGGDIDQSLKNMGRTLEGWMGVYQPHNDTITMPFYRLSMEPSDTASVTVQKSGHFCLSVLENETPTLLPIIYDPSKVFGEDTTLLHPIQLFKNDIADILEEQQYGMAKTPTAFAGLGEVVLAPGESVTISTYFGQADDLMDVPVIARRLLQPGFSLYKVTRSREIIRQITGAVQIQTANPLFDGHVQQMFLDNSLRGGIPSILGEIDDDLRMKSADEDERLKVFHLFSRVHGDLERDYNYFEIMPTFFSEGPGNFRDVAQNRRNDVIFNPRIGSFNVRTFLSFIQADAYEPLRIEAVIFIITDTKVSERIALSAVGPADGHRAQREALAAILSSGPFRPGQLFLMLEEQHIELILSNQDFIDLVASEATVIPSAVFSTGFWADHWTYYLDIVESFVSIFPDWEERIMFEEQLPYFFSPASVKPRSEKYVLSVSFDGRGNHVRQLDATFYDERKADYMKRFIENSTGWYNYQANWQHDADGNIFKSSPIAKLFLVATLKFATRDAYGMGIEYEGGRPGWNDANNGLVGMVGCGMPETYELVVLLRYLKSSAEKYGRDIIVPSELSELLWELKSSLSDLSVAPFNRSAVSATVPEPLFQYWDRVASARENYRDKTRVVFSGQTVALNASWVIATIDSWLEEIELGIQRAIAFGTDGDGDNGSSGLTPTHFAYNITQWQKTGEKNKDGHTLVTAQEMVVRIFPLFLEGPTRRMKTLSKDRALEVYNRLRSSPLRDEALKMYTISASLKGQSFDMGREMAFAPGWLENQSVWVHMAYKMYLELIRHDLFDQFFEEMTAGGMLPFMDADKYGRSLMECSSFIASSAFEDPSVRGRGFLARLSGSTAEFLSMWILMILGPQPFYLERTNDDSGALELRMKFLPALPRWLFKENKDGPPYISFKLFGSIVVTYYHARGDEPLYRVSPTRHMIGLRDGTVFNVTGSSIPRDLADKIRRVVFVETIDVYFE